ncbi:flagellar hook-basal body protein FliE [Methylobacterium sp. Leaf465]|uniref:flagellar hook-basal body complex protein FliE n=1 Tax=unclassified Methylobacterium TaxID=2615210 RepID=UPI0006FF1808|nr:MULTISPECIES: flagellar hook-basal body complex protein FliE [unclassified Methylobacterium]KQO66135.1 flagellar hook-basal body protein FliE [Methylobacterium sp. Leaf89]KQP68789.1 flagellar hook-basal body protein FliE [Methylobacterium sp. Leaf111]KQT81798.1 flagellar hook-basal body protein FliE [Methylobacterium sp. Leaf465]KQU26337.1 flagellar hook-basal body protein FliE [Methylobacterium sp. Leaf94]
MTSNAFAAGAYAAIQNIGAKGSPKIAPATGASGSNFTSLLTSSLDSVGEAGRKADSQALAVAGGKANVVDVVTAVAESETALQTLVAVRDRVISAYEEIMRMQI